MESKIEDYTENSADYSDDEDAESEMQGESGVQLGYIEKEENALFKDPDWRNWDGGKVGGTPIWLNPTNIPAPKTTQCERCGQPMRFILQIYCPVDDNTSGFHRCLYMFCCHNRNCLQNGSVKCLRTQLPRENQYYCFEPEQGKQLVQDKSPQYQALCAICGCRGGLTCSQCKRVNYCSKAHQKEHWKLHKLVCMQEGATDYTAVKAMEEKVRARSLFPEYTLAVEDEVFEGEDEEELKRVMQSANIWEDAVTEGGADEEADARLTQADYQRAMGSEVHDPTYINFLTRVERGGKDQVLRYCRAVPAVSNAGADGTQNAGTKAAAGAARSGNGLLLLSSDKELMRKRAAALESCPCPRCGAPRTFEFQIMPQLLHYLKVDQQTRLSAPELPPPPSAASGEGAADPPAAVPQGGRAFFNQNETDIDWGSLDVFTCSASCDVLSPGAGAASGDGSAYVEELVLLQPPIYKD